MSENARIEIDRSGRVVAFDAQGAALLGAEPSALVGRALVELINDSDLDRLEEAIIFGEGCSRSTGESAIVRLLHADGHSIWVDLVPVAEHNSPDAATMVFDARPFRRSEPADVDTSEPDPYHALVQRSADIVMIVDPEGTVRFVNTAMERLLGLEPDALVETNVIDIIHPDDHDLVTEVVVDVLAEPTEPQPFEFRTRHADGSYRWIDAWLQNLIDNPAVGGLLGTGRDVTDRHRAQVALQASEARFRSLASSSPSAIFEVDDEGALRFANDRWREVTGRTIAETSDVFGVLEASDAERLRRRWRDGARAVGLDEDVRVARPDGERRWVELHTRPVVHDDDEMATHVGILHDVTDVHVAQDELQHLATHDSLTGLPNRALLLERLGVAVEALAGTDQMLALLFVDLDRFKVVNDSLGHHAGDAVLTAVTGRLDALVRPVDLVARFGGDEFVVLCDPIDDREQAVALAERIRREVAGGVDVDGETVHVSVSVGVVIGTAQSTPETLLRDADVAMYAAKTRGRDRAQVFDDAMHRAAVERLSVEAGLRRALERFEFRLHFQPIVDVASGSVAGVEALVRWEHPERGLLAPRDFLGVAEESGVLRAIGPWILEHACSQAVLWPTPPGRTPPALFINLTAAQIANRQLVDTVERVVADTGIDPSRLVLEVTEGMLMTDADETAELLAALRTIGVRIAIDDFGTGYSSLSYLTRLPVDVLKIDQSFVAGLTSSDEDREVTGAIIALAHALGLVTVAEGVEDPGQLEALGMFGCELAQGFWFSPPLPAEQVAEALAR